MASHPFLPWPVLLALLLYLLSFRPVPRLPPTPVPKDRHSDEAAPQSAEPDVSRVINGKSVFYALWPFMASLRLTHGNHYCGGTIWNQNYILTAAHCLFTQKNRSIDVFEPIPPPSIWVYLGHSSLIHLDYYYLFQVSETTVHPNYTRVKYGNDIALLRLVKPINFTQYSRLGCTCHSRTPPSAVLRQRCYVVGWGTVNRFRPNQWASVLQDARVPLLDPSYCKSTAHPSVSVPEGSLLCAGFKSGYSDSCTGDSGGPLMCAISARPYVYEQTGIVSMGYNCSIAGRPGFYTSIHYYRDWIRNVTGC